MERIKLETLCLWHSVLDLVATALEWVDDQMRFPQ